MDNGKNASFESFCFISLFLVPVARYISSLPYSSFIHTELELDKLALDKLCLPPSKKAIN